MNTPESKVRCVIMTGEGPHFTAGLDLSSAAQVGSLMTIGEDSARTARIIAEKAIELHMNLTAFETCKVPVIAAMFGWSIGMAIDISSACDIRICSKDAKFTIKEIDIGMCADVGSH